MKFNLNILVFILIISVGLLASRTLIQGGYFPMHDDLQMMRQLELEKCFKDWQIPCRWVPDMGYGFGYPLFNFYPPLPYLVGEVLRIVGFAFTATAKTLFLLSLVLSGVSMYILAREFWGRLGGILSAIFYVWAPYHAVDVYVRGAMNESWALVFLPLILWASYKLISNGRVLPRVSLPASARSAARVSVTLSRVSPALNWIVVLTLSWTALLLSHNVIMLIFAPVFVLWVLLWLWQEKSWRKIFPLGFSGIWALGLAAFFTLPVVLEQKLVQVETLKQGYYEYIAHFATVKQLFTSQFWGYGPSVWGTTDGMAFPIGQIHWILALVIGALGLLGWLGRRKINSYLLLTLYFMLIVGFAAAFMSHSRSTFIWQAFPFLAIVQFPWRFLTIVILAFSFLLGAIAVFLGGGKKWAGFLVILLGAGVIIWNFNYFRVERIGPVTDQEKFSGEAWRLQQTAGIYDYLPKTTKIAPQSARKEAVEIASGSGTIKEVKQGTNWIKFKIEVTSSESTVRINIFQFPNWKVFIDGKQTQITTNNDELGRIHIKVGLGDHKIEARLFNTPVRTAGNLISLVSWLALITFPKWRKKIW